MNEKQQIERIKQEIALYLKIAERLKFPKEEVENQINLYLDELKKLLGGEEQKE